jgi:hypothetical protein
MIFWGGTGLSTAVMVSFEDRMKNSRAPDGADLPVEGLTLASDIPEIGNFFVTINPSTSGGVKKSFQCCSSQTLCTRLQWGVTSLKCVGTIDSPHPFDALNYSFADGFSENEIAPGGITLGTCVRPHKTTFLSSSGLSPFYPVNSW